MMNRATAGRPFPILTIVALFLGLGGCESGTHPVAPSGTSMAVTTNPASISLQGVSEIRVELKEQASGIPVREGTEIRLSTNLGQVEDLVRTDRRGVAFAAFQAQGKAGTATVAVSSGITSMTVDITIGSSLRPTASFTESVEGLAVIFSDASMGDPTSWSWAFGDGAGSSQREPVHTYGRAGTYLVQLTVANPHGEDSLSKQLTVPATKPVAGFMSEVSGLTVIFSDTSTGNPTSWSWELGDGARTSEREPVHAYDEAGSYVVKLTVRGVAGQEDSRSQVVMVPRAEDS